MYVAGFQRALSGVVSEELYVQEIVPQAFNPGAVPSVTRRQLRSDLLLVRGMGTNRYVQFRDVFDVDGQPVRDREERLYRLFVAPSASSLSQAQRIMTESARFNIGRIERTMNVPTLALLFLDPAYQARVRFKRSTDRTPTTLRNPSGGDDATMPLFRAAAEVWVVEFEERDKPTIIRTPKGADVPSRGRFWIDPVTGRVSLTELIAQDATVRGVVNVTYRDEPATGLVLPVAMRERYDGRDGLRIEGVASYSNFRRFDVRVHEEIRPPR
jgi:hypothetical protein